MANVAAYSKALGKRLLNEQVEVAFEMQRGKDPWGANFGPRSIGYELTFNVARLGNTFFNAGICVTLNDLLIHELAHKFGDHLSDEFDKAMSLLGAKLTELALREPEFFKGYGWGSR